MCRIILSSLACLAVPYFPHYLIKGTIFGKKLLHIKCVLMFSTNIFEAFLIIGRNERDIIINLHKYLCKVPVVYDRF